MYTKAMRIIGFTAVLLPLWSYLIPAQGSCIKECQIRSSYGNRSVKGADADKARDLFTQLTRDNIKACRDGCENEKTPDGCKTCAKRILTNTKLDEGKKRLQAFKCPEPNPTNVPCVAIQQPKVDYESPKQKEQKEAQDMDRMKRDVARRAADDLSKKVAEMEPKIQELYEKAEKESNWQQKLSLFAQAEAMAKQAVDEKLNEGNFRRYAEGKPHVVRTCVAECNGRLPPINGMELSRVEAIRNLAMPMVLVLVKKQVYECVRACTVKSDVDCGACALEQVPPEAQNQVLEYLTTNYGCGVGDPPETAPSAGHIALNVVASIFGAGGGGGPPPCPKMTMPGGGLQMIWNPPDPATLIKSTQSK